MGPAFDRQERRLRRQLTTDRVLTTVQLKRLGLLKVAEALDLPAKRLSCRTRVTQGHSITDLTFVALTTSLISRPQRELMHDAGIAEARMRSGLSGGNWQHVSVKGKTRLHLPDAEYVLLDKKTSADWAIEFDAGYQSSRIADKLRAADQDGYAQYLWATTIRARTGTFGSLLQQFQSHEALKTIRRVDVIFVNFWSQRPYTESSRNHKALSRTYFIEGDAVR